MNPNVFLFCYSAGSTILLSFLFIQARTYRKWYLILLIRPESEFRVQRFFIELKSIFQQFDGILEKLKLKKGAPLTDPCFQFRWMVWWKFFGPKTVTNAIKIFNKSAFLKKILSAPTKEYTRKKVQYFSEKLGAQNLEKMQEILITHFQLRGLIRWKTIIVDSFPVKSFLNVQKCLKRPNINYKDVKAFLNTINLSKLVALIEESTKKRINIEVKLKAVLVKEIWDLVSWNKCQKVLYGKQVQLTGIDLPVKYKSPQIFKDFLDKLRNRSDWQIIEKELVCLARQVLIKLGIKEKAWKPQILRDLNACWHKPHRWKDKGINLYHCASKNMYQYGRGGLIAVVESLELPIFVSLTPKYKQSKDAILTFFQRFFFRFSVFLEGIKILGDSEFGFFELRNLIKTIFNSNPIFPNYGNSSEKVKISKQDRDTRKMVERVIARLVMNWGLESPRHLSETYADFHLNLAVFCDLLQVTFNLQIGNYGHPHALKTIHD